MSLKNLTIIITTFRSEKVISECLNSIDDNVNVIIIENSQNYNFKQILEKKYKNIECIIPKENLGYSRANNLGLKMTKTKYALVLNPDAILEKNTLTNFLTSAERNPNFSLMGPINNQGGKTLSYSDQLQKELIEVKNLKGFAIFFNLTKLSSEDFFDENFFIYFEEIDLCRKILSKNGKIYLNTKLKINHLGGRSVDDKFNFEVEKNRNWHWMWSTFYYHKKYNNFFYAFILISPNLISSFFKSILYFIFFNKAKSTIYYYRLNGIINSILGKKSWYRPSLD